jgi:hypothetical protein
MDLYRINGRYFGTQADAKAGAKAAGVKFDPELHAEKVPTDKAGLIDYLNTMVFVGKGSDEPRLRRADEPASPSTEAGRFEPKAPANGKRDMSAGAILDRIDRQHAELALKNALSAVETGLALIRRKYSGEPERVEEEAEELLED